MASYFGPVDLHQLHAKLKYFATDKGTSYNQFFLINSATLYIRTYECSRSIRLLYNHAHKLHAYTNKLKQYPECMKDEPENKSLLRPWLQNTPLAVYDARFVHTSTSY